jgi:lipopolysaccharide export system permease protein
MELIRVLALIICVLTVLLVFVGVIREVSEKGLGPLQAIQILPFIVPSMLPFTIPATLLLAVCVVYGRLSADSEITAAKAAGINVVSLLSPAFLLGTVLTLSSLLLNDQVIPWSMANINRIVTYAMEDIFFDLLASQNQMSDPERGTAITVSRVDKANRKLIEPYIRFSPKGREPVVVQAKEATLRFDLEREEVILSLVDAWVDAPGRISLRLKKAEFPFPLVLDGQKIKPRHLSIRQIEARLDEISRETEETKKHQAIETAFALGLGDFDEFTDPHFKSYEYQLISAETQRNKHKTEMHNRFALSCSCFFFALVGGPFAILKGHRQFLTTFFICFMPILLIYYPVVLLTMNLSKTGSVDPAWAMWMGNLILLISAAVVLRLAVKH